MFLSKVSSFLSWVVRKLFYLLEFFLFLRLLLKFLGANSKTIVVEWIYHYSDILVTPFASIFGNIYWHGYLIEMAVISTMVGYAVAVFILLRLLGVFDKTKI